MVYGIALVIFSAANHSHGYMLVRLTWGTPDKEVVMLLLLLATCPFVVPPTKTVPCEDGPPDGNLRNRIER